MTPKGADLAATDLIEVSTLEAGSYVTKSITGQELIDAIPLPPTGLTVGTTPIASGTIGRVLFQGTGNVLQQSSSLFWDSTNNRLGIGTSTPSAIIHSVGSVTASAAIGRGNFLNNTLVASANNDVLAALDIQPTFTNGAFTGVLNHSIRTSQNTGIAIAIGDRSNQLGFANPALISLGASYGTNGLGNINNAKLLIFDGGGNGSSSAGLGYSLVGGAYQFEFFTQSNYVWSIGNGTPARTPQMRMFSTGNLLLQNGGTFTDAGFRLDVNGTARVRGTGTTSATTSFQVVNSAGSLSFRVDDNADVRIARDIAAFIRSYSTASGASFPSYSFSGNSSAGLYQDGVNIIGIATGGTSRLQIANTGNVLINTTTDAGYKLDVNGTAIFRGQLSCNQDLNLVNTVVFWSGGNQIRNTANGILRICDSTASDFNRLQLGGTTSAFPSIKRASNNIEIKNADDTFGAGLSVGASLNASAILQADSTTKGFLPPRMTTTQRNAIASPAAGLMVYDTTLNLPHFFNGTIWVSL